ncbi:hypothetical protein [Moheibacter sediminis]|uniref:Glycine zipper n=1 Tax=Moheibacter sediminis TaxID=1434700 RepID=A0A1W1ZPV8_9FLAO|nr:hypothetical protein [Moheibacter sediminis]SMC50293.1 hypothetical protein SAMN06296427_103132 [Moheibacter sediminis]
MKRLLYLCLFLGSLSFAQEFKQIKVTDENSSKTLKNVSVNFETNLLSYNDENGQFVTENIDKYEKIQVKKGTNWLAGMLGGMAGGFLGNAISRGKDEEIWYGAGPAILIGAGIGAIVGTLSPRYKVLKKENTSISLGLNSVKYTF